MYKAASNTSSKFKGLDETGIVMCCCRHGFILGALNLHCGESFRHTHYMHKEIAAKGYKFLGSDVVCMYWKFAERVGLVLEEFRPLTEKMTGFLGRLHATTHIWTCQVSLGLTKKNGKGIRTI